MNRKTGFINEISNCAYRESIFYLWLQLSLKGVSILDFFRANNFKRIIVYGYGKIGKLLCKEINGSPDIELIAVLDRAYMNIQCEYSIISPEDIMPDHDLVISTISDTNYVRNVLLDKTSIIIGFDELLKGFFEYK